MFKPLLALGALLAALTAAQRVDRVGPLAAGGTLVPTGQAVRPAGETLTFGGRPVDLALAPDEKTLIAKDDRGLVVVDLGAWKVTQELRFPAGGGSMHGIAFSADGGTLYATTAQAALWEATRGDGGAWAWRRKVALPGPGGRGDSHPCGIALGGDGRTAFVCLSRRNTLGVVDLEKGELAGEIAVGVAPFDVGLMPDGKRAWVSNWGGRRPHEGERTAPSSGTPTLIDARGVASSGTVSLVDLEARREVAQVDVGLHPSDLALAAGGQRLYVANANGDTVSIVDTATRRALAACSVRPAAGLPFGSAPNALALGAAGRELYVANGGSNALAVLSLDAAAPERSAPRGFIPTAWYPSALAAGSDWLYVACAKGFGSRQPKAGKPGWHVTDYQGTITRVRPPDDAALRRYTAQAREDGRVPEILAVGQAGKPARSEGQRPEGTRKPAPRPVPARVGEPSVFEHVVYIIKENRTYDQVFGDLPQGNGDPKLCLFGREVTPNHHALAEQFALLDNFYCNGVLSADGHSWATEGNVTDHLEKSFGGFTRSYTFGDDPLTYSASGFLWDGALRLGRTVRNYGEFDYAEPVPASAGWQEIYHDFSGGERRIRFTQNIGVETVRRFSCPAYPGWNMAIPDVLRADVFLKELAEHERRGSWPNLILLFLPQDHTSGTSPGVPTPRAHLADNDLALGRVVEGISRSRFWPRTCIFVIEDDPQDGFDHVDGHRSLCLVVSPYTKRGAVVSRFYNQTSVLHTMERILGLPPMNQFDAMAPLMTDCFVDRPDLRPYQALPNGVPLDQLNPPLSALGPKERHWARRSMATDFRHVDAADEDTLNRILWHSVKGVGARYPAELAGARDGRNEDDD